MQDKCIKKIVNKTTMPLSEKQEKGIKNITLKKILYKDLTEWFSCGKIIRKNSGKSKLLY